MFAPASDQEPDSNLSSSSSSSTPPFPSPCGRESSTGTDKTHTVDKTDNVSKHEQKCDSTSIPQTTTRSGRTVQRRRDPDFVYDDDL